jgi:hypothetical protein
MANYRIPELTPPPIEPASQVAVPELLRAPPNATSAFFYSDRQASFIGVGTIQGTSDGVLHYTREFSLTAPDAQQRIAEYLAKFPDARFVAFGDALMKASMPAAALPISRSILRSAEP